MSKPIQKIVILGGGTAGWLTAGILAAEHGAVANNSMKHSTNEKPCVEITLIESKNIPTIGVGEGTWPTMRETLNTIGISELEFISCCDASFKQGSQFVNWHADTNSNANHDSSNNSYYHPFLAPHGFGQSNLVDFWQKSQNGQNENNSRSFAHSLSCQPHLCDHFKAPKQFQTPPFAAVANYGYHLDAGKFAQLLTRHCTEKLGVKHIQDDVLAIQGTTETDIEALVTQEHGTVSGDMFIDCSGMRALLIGQHYNIPLHNQKNVLFNDSAIAVQVPYSEENSPIASHTIATAHNEGWIWDIGLPTRRGIGCVYASDYLSQAQAQQRLNDYLLTFNAQADIDKFTFRPLSFTPGYRKTLWHKNCVAVGMSAGFIEPLEASAIALVELSAKMIAKELPADKHVMHLSAKRFNQRFNYRWERVIEFLKLHYVLSERTSQYWQDNRKENTIPERLKELLQLWKYQPPSFNDFTQIEEVFPAASYQYVLYGMGFSTQQRAMQSRYNNDAVSEKSIKENNMLIDKYLGGLPTNRELINYLVAHDKQQRLTQQIQ